MAYIPPEAVAKAREMDLFTYLKNYEPGELVHVSGDTYCTRTHDSLKISNGKWCWFSHGIGGRSALDYLIKVNGLSFVEAVEQIVGWTEVQPPVSVPMPKKEKPKTVLLPPRNRDSTRVERYLLGRGIDRELIQFCMRTGRLYESSLHHNVVFVGQDKNGKARYANLRGTVSDFKGEASGSDKRFSFRIPAEGSCTIHLFESAIDLLSYATLQMQEGQDWQKDHLLSLAGIYQPKKEIRESSVPLALQQYLADYLEVDSLVLRLDNDHAGQMMARALAVVLSEKYRVTIRLPPQGKDYNDTLCICKGLAPVPHGKWEKER